MLPKFSEMRQRFDAQQTLGQTPIEDIEIPTKTRFQLANLLEALQYIYTHPKWNRRVFSLLEEQLMAGKKRTGRTGMSLWELFVLAQVRLCLNTSFDQLHFMANDSELLRGILGVLPTDYSAGKPYEYQQIYDNVRLLDAPLLRQINETIVQVGHQVFKKKEEDLRLKTDSFVVETDVHYPTDYNLLWDSGRKCIELATHLEIPGWRKHTAWKRTLKGLMRQVGRACKGGGRGKAGRVQKAVRAYLKKARALEIKTTKAIEAHVPLDPAQQARWESLCYYRKMLTKHIDLVERRLVDGEQIPHQEKVFSVFQPWTELIKKGKRHPSVEFGKNLAITSDQYHLVLDWEGADGRADPELLEDIAPRITERYSVQSWSTDKGFSRQQLKAELAEEIPQVIMPKKGRRTAAERTAEAAPAFRRLKNQHSAVESNINELEHRGLDRCPDRTLPGFKRYVGLAVTAYNLQKIGRHLRRQRRKKQAA